ncbi:hypothetical protein, partial [Meiothermus hypogaeus]|uniref:hypothetical protein n=1 Tax=Meiothermus hypogaeus TaxID=884155 RepID=UPI001C99705B
DGTSLSVGEKSVSLPRGSIALRYADNFGPVDPLPNGNESTKSGIGRLAAGTVEALLSMQRTKSPSLHSLQLGGEPKHGFGLEAPAFYFRHNVCRGNPGLVNPKLKHALQNSHFHVTPGYCKPTLILA